MRATPLATDGQYIYTLACYRTDKWDSPIKRVVCEVYELVEKTITRVAEVPLLRKDGTTPYHGSKTKFKDHEGWASHCTIESNGSLLFLGTPCNVHIFDLSTGIRKFKKEWTKSVKYYD